MGSASEAASREGQRRLGGSHKQAGEVNSTLATQGRRRVAGGTVPVPAHRPRGPSLISNAEAVVMTALPPKSDACHPPLPTLWATAVKRGTEHSL